MPSITTLVNDINELCSTGNASVDPILVEKYLLDFADRVKEVARALMLPKTKDLEKPYLRPSNIGTPDRKLWFMLHSEPRDRPVDPDQMRSYAFGSILEHLLVLLAKVSGHEVTEEQAEVNVEGIKGNKDFKVDGITVDAKSVSPWAWTKWETGDILKGGDGDIFGYREQLSLYSEGEETAGWLAINKSSGALALVLMDMFSRIRDVKGLVVHKKSVADMPEPPSEKCFAPEPEGKSGNMKIAKGCVMCAFKKECWGDSLRAFKYSTGLTYLTHVVKTPNVEEIPLT